MASSRSHVILHHHGISSYDFHRKLCSWLIYIYIYHIVAVEVYCEISCVEYSCHEIKNVLRKNLIDVIGKVLCCNADQSMGTALLCKNTCHMVWLSSTNAHTFTNQNVT
jgi:hypothetical protein